MPRFLAALATAVLFPLAAVAQIAGEKPPPPDPLVVSANEKLAKGDLDAALADFQALVKKGPADMSYRSRCIEIMLLKKDPKAAIAVCDEFLEANKKDNYEGFAARADIRLATNDYAASAEDYAESLRRAEKFGRGRWATDPIAIRLWVVRSLGKESPKANEDLALQFAGQPRSPKGSFYNDIAFFLLGEETEADLLKAAGNLGGGNDASIQSEFYAAIKALVNANGNDALDHFEKARELGAKRPQIWEMRVLATVEFKFEIFPIYRRKVDPLEKSLREKLAKGELDAAVADFRALGKQGPTKLSPNKFEFSEVLSQCRKALVEALLLKDDTKAAIAVCDEQLKSVVEDGDVYQVYAARADIRFSMREFKAAAEDYADSLRSADKFSRQHWATDPIALRLWVARSLAAQGDKANEDLTLHFVGLPRSPKGSHFNDIAFYLLGEETETDMMKAVGNSGPANECWTEAEYYAGMKSLVKGNELEARAHLEKAGTLGAEVKKRLGANGILWWEARMAGTVLKWIKKD